MQENLAIHSVFPMAVAGQLLSLKSLHISVSSIPMAFPSPMSALFHFSGMIIGDASAINRHLSLVYGRPFQISHRGRVLDLFKWFLNPTIKHHILCFFFTQSYILMYNDDFFVGTAFIVCSHITTVKGLFDGCHYQKAFNKWIRTRWFLLLRDKMARNGAGCLSSAPDF